LETAWRVRSGDGGAGAGAGGLQSRAPTRPGKKAAQNQLKQAFCGAFSSKNRSSYAEESA